MSLSPPAASSPVVEGKPFKEVLTPTQSLEPFICPSYLLCSERQREETRAPAPPKASPGEEYVKRGEESNSHKKNPILSKVAMSDWGWTSVWKRLTTYEVKQPWKGSWGLRVRITAASLNKCYCSGW